MDILRDLAPEGLVQAELVAGRTAEPERCSRCPDGAYQIFGLTSIVGKQPVK